MELTELKYSHYVSVMTAVQLYKKLHQANIRGQVHIYFKWEAERCVFILCVYAAIDGKMRRNVASMFISLQIFLYVFQKESYAEGSSTLSLLRMAGFFSKDPPSLSRMF